MTNPKCNMLPIMKIKFNHWFFKLPVLKNYLGIYLFGTAYIQASKAEVNPGVLAHEMVHHMQYHHFGWLGFYSRYVWYWIKALLKHRSFENAYYENEFEREARVFGVSLLPLFEKNNQTPVIHTHV